MALNFPDSPTNGQVFDKWTYNAASGSWRLTGDGGTLPPWMRTKAPPAMSVPYNTNVFLPVAGGSEVYDPYAMISTNSLVIPAAGVGLWQVNVTFAIGSHDQLSEVDCWIVDPLSQRYGTVRAIANAIKGQMIGSSAIIPITSAGQLIQFGCYQLNPSAISVSLGSLTAARVS